MRQSPRLATLLESEDDSPEIHTPPPLPAIPAIPDPPVDKPSQEPRPPSNPLTNFDEGDSLAPFCDSEMIELDDVCPPTGDFNGGDSP